MFVWWLICATFLVQYSFLFFFFKKNKSTWKWKLHSWKKEVFLKKIIIITKSHLFPFLCLIYENIFTNFQSSSLFSSWICKYEGWFRLIIHRILRFLGPTLRFLEVRCLHPQEITIYQMAKHYECFFLKKIKCQFTAFCWGNQSIKWF